MLVPLPGRVERPDTCLESPQVTTVVTALQDSTEHGPCCPKPLSYHGEQTPGHRSVSCSLSWTPKWK